jgi:hypothetical protein
MLSWQGPLLAEFLLILIANMPQRRGDPNIRYNLTGIIPTIPSIQFDPT